MINEQIVERPIIMNGKNVNVLGSKLSFGGKLFDKQWHLLTLVLDTSTIELMIDGISLSKLNSNPATSKGVQLLVNYYISFI